MEEEIKVRIGANVQGFKQALNEATRSVDNFANSATKSVEKSSVSFTKVKTSWLALTAAIYASIQVIEGGWKVVRAAAEYDKQSSILDNLATKYNSTALDIVESMARASGGMISNTNLMREALEGIARDLTPEQLINLAEAAKILGDAAGQSATTALKALTNALETGRVRGLKPYLKTAINLEDTFGELYSQLTETEKAQALYNLVMISAIDLQDKQTKAVDDTADKMDKLAVKWDNLKLKISSYLKIAAVGIVEMFSSTEGAFGGPEAASGMRENGRFGPQRRKIINPASTNPYEEQIKALKDLLSNRDASKKGGLLEKWSETKAALEGDISKSSLSEFEQKIIDIQLEAEKLKKIFKNVSGASGIIDKWSAESQSNILMEKALAASELDRTTKEKLKQEEIKYNEDKLKILEDFNLAYEELGLDQFDMERLQLERQLKLWRIFEDEKGRIAEYSALKLKTISREENAARLDFYSDAAGSIANTFLQIAQAGGKYSKDAFRIYQASAMAQAGISAASAILKSLDMPPPYNFIMAAVTGAAAAVQVATIASAKPPSYDQGGISNAGRIYQTGNIQEAHVPIPSGKIPVEIRGNNNPPPAQNVVEIHVQGNTFADPEKERRIISTIIGQAVEKLAPNALVRNYYNGGIAYQTFRGR